MVRLDVEEIADAHVVGSSPEEKGNGEEWSAEAARQTEESEDEASEDGQNNKI
jgi:hypothetical protein